MIYPKMSPLYHQYLSVKPQVKGAMGNQSQQHKVDTKSKGSDGKYQGE
jgi:hypothetical protein